MRKRMTIETTRTVEFEVTQKEWDERWSDGQAALMCEFTAIDTVEEGARKNVFGVTVLSVEDNIAHYWLSDPAPNLSRQGAPR